MGSCEVVFPASFWSLEELGSSEVGEDHHQIASSKWVVEKSAKPFKFLQ